MTDNNKTKNEKDVIFYLTFFVLVWTALCIVITLSSIAPLRKGTIQLATLHARTAIQRDILFRRWLTGHGGVYVPVTDQTPASQYLSHIKERDITSSSGRKLTLINPAYAMRQLNDLAALTNELEGRITSLKPLNPKNYPDPWEKKVLETFETKPEEVINVEINDNEKYLRLMLPMITEIKCLKCHASQGFTVGDIRGAVSISVPLRSYLETEKTNLKGILINYSTIWLTGVLGIIFAIWKMHKHLKCILLMNQKTKDLARFPNENPNPIMRISSHGKILFANDAARNMLESWNSNEEYPLKEEYRIIIEKTIDSEEAYSQVFHESDGKSYSIMFTPEKKAGYVNLYAIDITDLQERSKELVEKQDQLKIKIELLEKMNRFTGDREKRIIQLKEEVNALLGELGRKREYGDFMDSHLTNIAKSTSGD